MAFEEARPHDAGPSESPEDLGASFAEDLSWWVGLGWFAAAALLSALVVALSLPAEPAGLDRPYAVSDVVRVDWLILATFLCYLLRRCARASLLCGLAAVVLCSAQSFYVVSAALERLDSLHITTAAPWLWYLIPSVQLVAFIGFGISGARRRVADLRWKRLITSLLRDAGAPSRRRWRQAH
ncbi:MAG: hypothetical protein H0T17_10280 [Propionibacteriales bacterium]|nr:hypothetical protein [Propionibacteriales bacterium]